MNNERILLLLKQSRSYVILARLLRSDYYRSRAKASLAMARFYINEQKEEIKLVA